MAPGPAGVKAKQASSAKRCARSATAALLPRWPHYKFKTLKSDESRSFWGFDQRLRRQNLQSAERSVLATSIFHIRRRLAWHRVASHAPGWRLGTCCTRKLHAVERPSHQRGDNVRISSRIRSSSHPRAMDAFCRNANRFDYNWPDLDPGWRSMDSAFAGDYWRRSRHVRTGLMVRRCAPFWVEARRGSPSQEVVLTLPNAAPEEPNFLPQKKAVLRPT